MGLSSVVTAGTNQCHEESKATYGISREKNCQQGLAMSSLDMKDRDIGGR